ncbi:MAG: hypothetical protein IPK82_24265 [Polyangiaceae bacterium]|nr:hypothetical protein [Polyangiaceae bacterium]
MPSHFSTIGFPIDTEQEFLSLAEQVYEKSEILTCPGGRYHCWNRGKGEELWLQVDSTGALIGMNPHFSGKSVLRVGLQERLKRSSDSDLDGAFHGWASAKAAPYNDGACPFVFDMPDARVHDKLHLPTLVTVQVVGFAHEVNVYSSVEEYDSLSKSGEVAFASQSFIPSGLFSPDMESVPEPAAQAIITGHVIETETRHNSLTGKKFYWSLVETYGGNYDIVFDPELAAAPQQGGVISGSFWLSGRILSHPN